MLWIAWCRGFNKVVPVFRPSRFDGTLCTYGPGGFAGGHFGVSETRRQDRAALRRVRGRYIGDGVLVYFGYPRAHEDDAERAVQAGLELVRAVTALSLKICEV